MRAEFEEVLALEQVVAMNLVLTAGSADAVDGRQPVAGRHGGLRGNAAQVFGRTLSVRRLRRMS